MKLVENKDSIDVFFENDKECDLFEAVIDEAVYSVLEKLSDEDDDVIIEEDFAPINLDKEIEKVTFNEPATIVFWKDGTKTVSKCSHGDTFNKETGLAMCIIRKLCNNRNYNKVFEKYYH